ncbi:hypothetical protein [Campylobacter geochelonis]|uniref:hypothetical protein n=1 Tax=Campylobacter geochelonis TaxID=1780362 RepID=UPI0007707A91|nr:hypothetical protein [Campylobacter geochelonis]CZE48193.1 Uncharacterised protein [Campylobacter geochelonis]
MYKTDLETAKNSKKKIIIAKANKEIKDALNDDTIENIYLSEWTIASHKHHDNITAFDYFLLHDILKRKAITIKHSQKENHIIGYYYRGIYYKIVFKKTSNKEIFIQSVVKGKTRIEKDIKR